MVCLAERVGGRLLDLVTLSPLVAGLGRVHSTETALTWHATLGVPYVPASSVKGVLRARARATGKDFEKFLGPEPESDHLAAGGVIFFDLLPAAPLKLVLDTMTPHYGPWYQAERPERSPPGDWYDPVPVPFLAVEPDQPFYTVIVPRDPTTDLEEIVEIEGILLQTLQEEGVGAKTNLGYGRFLTQPASGQPSQSCGSSSKSAKFEYLEDPSGAPSDPSRWPANSKVRLKTGEIVWLVSPLQTWRRTPRIEVRYDEGDEQELPWDDLDIEAGIQD